MLAGHLGREHPLAQHIDDFLTDLAECAGLAASTRNRNAPSSVSTRAAPKPHLPWSFLAHTGLQLHRQHPLNQRNFSR